MEHQSLCSATGMPHSTQMRTRCTGAGVFCEKSRLRNDIPVSRYGFDMLSIRNERQPGYSWSKPVGRAGRILVRPRNRAEGWDGGSAPARRRCPVAGLAQPRLNGVAADRVAAAPGRIAERLQPCPAFQQLKY